jgi:hypothetical protein
MATLYTHQQLPSSTQEAIRKFDEKYLALISSEAPSGWADRFVATVDSPLIKYPMSVITARFKATKEQSGLFEGLDGKSFELNVSEFDAGFEAKVFDLLTNVFEWKRWNEGPAILRDAERRHYAWNLARILEANGTCPYDDLALFHASHKSNPVKDLAVVAGDGRANTFSNYQSVAADAADLTVLRTEMTAMRNVRGPDGYKLGVNPTEIWLPTEKFEAVAQKLNQENLANGETNPMKGKLKPVEVPELTDANDWYLVDPALIAKGFDPMVVNKYTELDARLGMRWLDENSDHFKKTGKIAVSQHIWCGFSVLFPHAIRKVVGS